MNSPKKLKYCVKGEWKESKSETYMPITDSSTGQVIAEAPCCTKEEVNEAVESAKQAFTSWSDTPVVKRTEIMFKFRNALEVHVEELAISIAKELGKNIVEARGDIFKAIEAVELACSTPLLMQGDSIMNVSSDFDTVMYREPVGVFVGIAPFNFPAMIPFGWMIPLCITTGNTMVLKASSLTPLTSVRMLELLYEVGLPKGVVNLVTCSRNEAELFLKHPDVRGISYVGSTTVGKHIYMTAAAHGKKVQALCEAKNHALVLKDVNIEAVVHRIINATFGCAGMRCMALPVICVEEVIADDFITCLIKHAKERKVGCAYDQATELGPLVSAQHKEFVEDWIVKGIDEGAELVLDGRNIVAGGYESGFFIGPTIFDHVKPGMSIGESEIFGPVACIKRVRDFEEGITIMNESRFANGSCIFTENGYYAREFTKRTHAGMVGVNVGIPVPISVFPFTGHKDSFFGDLHVLGRDGVAFFTQAKCVTSTWLSGEDKIKKVGTWEGTTSRV